MANNYELGTVSPYFPPKLVEKYREEIEALNVNIEEDGYIYCEEGCEDWDELSNILQRMLIDWTDEGAARYAYIKGCFYCDKMRQDEFGGFAIFVTRESKEWVGTDSFILDQIGKLEGGEPA